MKKQFISVSFPNTNATSRNEVRKYLEYYLAENKNPFQRAATFEETGNSDQALQKMLTMDEVKTDKQLVRQKSRKHNFSPEITAKINRQQNPSLYSYKNNSIKQKHKSPISVFLNQSPQRRLTVSQHLDQMKNTQKAVEAAMKIKNKSQLRKHPQKVTARMKGKTKGSSRNTSNSPQTSVMHHYGGVNLVLPIQQNVEHQQNHDQLTLIEISDVLSSKIDRIQSQIATMNANRVFSSNQDKNYEQEIQKLSLELLQKTQEHENLKLKYITEQQQWQMDRGMLSRLQIEINKLNRRNQQLQNDKRYQRNNQEIVDAPRPLINQNGMSPIKEIPTIQVQLLANKDDLIQQLSQKLNESTKIIKQQLVQMVTLKNQSQDPNQIEHQDKFIKSLQARISELESTSKKKEQSKQQLAAVRAQCQSMLAEQASQFTLEIVKLGNESKVMQELKTQYSEKTQNLIQDHIEETTNLRQQLDQALFEIALGQSSGQPNVVEQLQQQVEQYIEENQNLIKKLQGANVLEQKNAELIEELKQGKLKLENMKAEYNRRIMEMASTQELEVLNLKVDRRNFETIRSELQIAQEQIAKLKAKGDSAQLRQDNLQFENIKAEYNRQIVEMASMQELEILNLKVDRRNFETIRSELQLAQEQIAQLKSVGDLEPHVRKLRQDYDLTISKEAAQYQMQLSYLVAQHKIEMLACSDGFISRINIIEQENANLRIKLSNTIDRQTHATLQQSLQLQLQARNNDFESQEAMLLHMVKEIDEKEQLVAQLQTKLEAQSLNESPSKGSDVDRKLEMLKEENKQLKQQKKELSLEKAKAVKEHMLKANDSKKELKAKDDLIAELKAQIPKAEPEDKDSILWRLNEQLSQEIEGLKKQVQDSRQLDLLKDELNYQIKLVASLQTQLNEVQEQGDLERQKLLDQIQTIQVEHQRELNEQTDVAIEQISDLERKIEEAESELSNSKQAAQQQISDLQKKIQEAEQEISKKKNPDHDRRNSLEDIMDHKRRHSADLLTMRSEKEELLKQTLLIKKMHQQELSQMKNEKEELLSRNKTTEIALNSSRSEEENLKRSLTLQAKEIEDKIKNMHNQLEQQATDHAKTIEQKDQSHTIQLQQQALELKEAHQTELDQMQEKNNRETQSQREQINQLTEQVELITSQHQSTQQESEAKNQMIDKLHKQLKQLIDEQASKRITPREHQQVQSRVVELESEIQELESKLLQAKQETQDLIVVQQQTIRSKESQISAQRQEHSEVVSAHASQMLQIQSALSEREDNLRKIVAENSQQTSKLKQQIEEINKDASEKEQRHKGIIKNGEDQILQHQEKIQVIEAQLAQAKSEIAELQSKIQDSDLNHKNELDEMTQTCMNEIAEMENKLDQNQEQLAICSNQIEEKEQLIAELEEQLRQAQQEASDSLQLVNEREHEHGLMVQQIDSLETEVQQLHESLETLQKENEAISAQLDQVKKEGKSKDSSVEEMVMKLSMQNAIQGQTKDRQIGDLQQKLAEGDKKVEFLNQEIAQLQTQIKTSQEDLKKEREEAQHNRKEIRQLQGQFEDTNKIVVAKDEEIIGLKNQLSAKQQELTKEIAQCQQLRKESNLLQQQFEGQVNQMLATSVELKQYKAKAANVDAMKQMNDMLQAELQAKDKEMNKFKSDVQSQREVEAKKHQEVVTKLTTQIAQIMMSK